MFEGATVAIVTPFRGGALDLKALRAVVHHVVEAGIDGIVAIGSTGEGATLSAEERRKVLELVVAEASERAFVIAGTGTNSTEQSIQLSRTAKEVGVDGLMLVTPYYNKPTPEGLVRHYEAVARAVPLPIIVYNVPSRTGLTLKVETAAKLAHIDQVVAIKEAGGSLDQATELVSETELTVLSGDDSLTLPMMAVGARGIVSVVANLVPADVKTMVDAALRGDFVQGSRLHHQLYPLAKAMFIETNPAPVKHALSTLGLIADELRLPLVPVSRASAHAIDEALKKYGVTLSAGARA